MKKSMATAALAASTILTCAAAQAQTTASGTLGNEIDYFLTAGSNVPSGQGFLFSTTVANAANFGSNYDASNIPFDFNAVFYLTSLDISRPVNRGPFPVFSLFLPPNPTGQQIWNVEFLPGTFADGDELVIVVYCSSTCPPGTSFDLNLTGAGAVSALGLGPTAEEIAAALTAEQTQLIQAAGGAARLVVMDASGVTRDLGQVSLATRNNTPVVALAAAPEGGTEVTLSTQSSAPGMMGSLYTWAQVTGFRSNEDDGPANIGGSGIQIGGDFAIAPNMVAGVSLGYSDVSATDGAFSQEGTLTYLQPYFAYASGAWHGNASVIYGIGNFDQTSMAGDGSGDTELLAFTFEGGYDIALQNGFTVTPTLGLIHGREIVEGVSGTLAGAAAETYEFTQASVGALATYEWGEGALFAGIHADYLTHDAGSVLTDEFLAEDGWTGRLELGASMDLANGLGLATSVELSGLGGTAQTVAGGLRVALTF